MLSQDLINCSLFILITKVILTNCSVNSRDPLLVTLDLVSDGFNDQQVLRSVLENSIGRGSIGPYGVSREGFSFKSLQPGKWNEINIIVVLVE